MIKDPTKLKKTIIIVGFLEKLLALLVALAVAGVLLVIVYRQNQAQRVGDLLVDCTTPGHPCYVREQERTADTLKHLEQIIILANICAGKESGASEERIAHCIQHGIAQIPPPPGQPRTTPAPKP